MQQQPGLQILISDPNRLNNSNNSIFLVLLM